MTFDGDPEVTYCTPEDVADTLDLPDPNDAMGSLSFSDMSHPSYRQVCRMIRSNEDIIDKRIRRSWRENRVKDELRTISTYWHDLNGWRSDYYAEGGDFVKLAHKDVLPWDTAKGDRLEVRTRLNQWTDISMTPYGEPDGDKYSWNVWFDYPLGKLYIKTRFFQQRYNALRITYRYGTTGEEVPASINRLCCLLTASQVINMQPYNIKVGMGGDISGTKDTMLRVWQDEMNQIWSSWQRSGSVHSMLR